MALRIFCERKRQKAIKAKQWHVLPSGDILRRKATESKKGKAVICLGVKDILQKQVSVCKKKFMVKNRKIEKGFGRKGRRDMVFEELYLEDEKIREMSSMAKEIVREHFDPIIGKAQNDYMIQKFQTEHAIREQLKHGYRYFFVKKEGRNLGFLACYPRGDAMYLSKFYLYRQERRKGYAWSMLEFVVREARKEGLSSIELNVNKENSAIHAYEHLGFRVIRTEKNDIGEGFFMDDFVYSLAI